MKEFQEIDGEDFDRRVIRLMEHIRENATDSEKAAIHCNKMAIQGAVNDVSAKIVVAAALLLQPVVGPLHALINGIKQRSTIKLRGLSPYIPSPHIPLKRKGASKSKKKARR